MTIADPVESTRSTDVDADAAESTLAATAETVLRHRPGRWRPADVAIVLIALSPFVYGAWSVFRRGVPPGALFGDRALLGLNVIDAWRAPVLLGPYSRFYWHHPGPLYFYLLKAWSSVFGSQSTSLVLGVIALNVATAVGILVLARRRGGRVLLVWTALLLTAYLVAIDPIPFDIWNPSATLLPFVVVLLLAWSLTCRDWWTAPWLAFVGCFAVQTHVGLAPGVATAIGLAVFVAVWRQRRGGVPLPADERRSVRRATLVSVVVAFVMWLPPLIEQLTGREGNLTLLKQFFSRPGSPHTLGEGIEATGLQATLMLRSLFEPISLRSDAHQGIALAVVLSAVAFLLAVVAARRARDRDASVLLVLVAVELLAAVYGVTRIVGPIQFYLVQWISAIGFVLWVAVGNATLAWLRTRATSWSWPRPTVRVATVVVVVLLCAGVIRALPGAAGLINEDLDVPNNRDLFGYVPTAELLRATRPGQTVTLRLDSVTAWEVMAADALLLVQHGRHVQVVESPVTRLLFDDSLRVDHASGQEILAFRDRPRPELGPDATLVAYQGEWAIVDVGR